MTRYALRCAGVALALGASLSLSALGFADTAAPPTRQPARRSP